MKSLLILVCLVIICSNCAEPNKKKIIYDLKNDKIFSQKSSGVELGGISQIRGYNKNELYLLDFYSSQILRYILINKSFINIGREGKGPGEFQGILSIGFLNDKTLVVYDFIQRKFSFFSEEGIFLKAINFSEDVKKFEIDSHNNIYIQTRNIKIDGKNIKTIYNLAKYNSELKRVANIETVELVRDIFINNPRPIKMPIGFSPDFIWNLKADGRIVTCITDRNIVNIFKDSLKVESYKLNDLPKYKIHENDKAKYFEEIRNKTDRQHVEFAEFKPFITEILIIGTDIFLKGNKINDNLNEYFIYDQKFNFKYKVELEGNIFSGSNYFIGDTIYYAKYSEKNDTEIFEGKFNIDE